MMDGLVGSGPAKINVPAGGTVQVFGWTGDKPVNVGLGTLSVFPDIVTDRHHQPSAWEGTELRIVLNGSYPLVIQAATIPLTGPNSATTFGFCNLKWRLRPLPTIALTLVDKPALFPEHSGRRDPPLPASRWARSGTPRLTRTVRWA